MQSLSHLPHRKHPCLDGNRCDFEGQGWMCENSYPALLPQTLLEFPGTQIADRTHCWQIGSLLEEAVLTGQPVFLPTAAPPTLGADSDDEFAEEITVEKVSDAALLASSVLASHLAKDPVRVCPVYSPLPSPGVLE